jgi:O-antigen/teichoic acid export membrane protein
MKDLKQRVIRGGFAKISSQATSFLIRIGSMMILARLLNPKDFGLVGMVTAVTGFVGLFRDFGLSAAAVQRTNVTQEQASTLFWINLLVGTILTLFVLAMSPFVARFYHEPKLLGVTAVLSTAFLFSAAGAQPSAILERQLRYTALSVFDIVSLLTSILVGIGMALRGYGYWALVASATVTPLVYTVCVWISAAWFPGMPRRQVGMRSMMRFGGTLTANSVVWYGALNFEKVLLGRFWGADAIGIYGRAYQLINIPNDNLNSAVSGVAFATLSRLQDDPSRFRSYFLKGYALILSLTVPITVACGLFAGDMISVFLGPKWTSAVPIFRLLAPTTIAFAIINPMGWLLMSLGLVARGLKIALVVGPLMIAGYAAGLHYGPKGVAFAYSAMMMTFAFPMIAWSIHGTAISMSDILQTVSRPFLSGFVAAGLAMGLQFWYGPLLSPLPRLILGAALMLATYVGMLLYVMGQKFFYLDILRGFFKSPSVDAPVVVST